MRTVLDLSVYHPFLSCYRYLFPTFLGRSNPTRFGPVVPSLSSTLILFLSEVLPRPHYFVTPMYPTPVTSLTPTVSSGLGRLDEPPSTSYLRYLTVSRDKEVHCLQRTENTVDVPVRREMSTPSSHTV